MVEYIDYERCPTCDEQFESGPYLCPRCGTSVRNTRWENVIAVGLLLALGIGIGVAAFAVWRCMT